MLLKECTIEASSGAGLSSFLKAFQLLLKECTIEAEMTLDVKAARTVFQLLLKECTIEAAKYCSCSCLLRRFSCY